MSRLVTPQPNGTSKHNLLWILLIASICILVPLTLYLTGQFPVQKLQQQVQKSQPAWKPEPGYAYVPERRGDSITILAFPFDRYDIYFIDSVEKWKAAYYKKLSHGE